MTENSMFTEVQEESAGVNQSTEGAGDLASYQPHWVSQIWPSEPLHLVPQDLVSSEDGLLVVSLPGGRVPLEWLWFPSASDCSCPGFFPPTALPAADWMLLTSSGPLLGSSACGFE